MDSHNSVVQCLQHVLSEKAPFLIIAVLCVLGAVPGLYLPETSDLKMPDSLEDIQEVGRSDINLNTTRRQSLSSHAGTTDSSGCHFAEEGGDSGKLKRQNHKAAEFAANLLVTLTEGGSCIPELH